MQLHSHHCSQPALRHSVAVLALVLGPELELEHEPELVIELSAENCSWPD